MQAAANNKDFAKTVGIPQKVAKDYMKKDMTVYSVMKAKK